MSLLKKPEFLTRTATCHDCRRVMVWRVLCENTAAGRSAASGRRPRFTRCCRCTSIIWHKVTRHQDPLLVAKIKEFNAAIKLEESMIEASSRLQ